MTTTELGPVWTKGSSFRARAEARQRQYRTETLQVPWHKHGHWLADAAALAGENFVVPEAHRAARARDCGGKGVGERTFYNMLASQAMCFNLFAPMRSDFQLAANILCKFIPGLASIETITIEHTPSNEIFGDQTALGGVDCDVFIEATREDGRSAIIVLETKFVEPEFSVCGFRKPGRAKKGKAVCPDGLVLLPDDSSCLYATRKHYRYWDWTRRLGVLRDDKLGGECPFGGELWQLWTNRTLAGAEAERRGAAYAASGVCAPAQNEALLEGGRVLERFRECLSDPSTLLFIPLDALIEAICAACEGRGGERKQWAEGLAARYHGI